MKTKMRHISCILMLTLLTCTLFAQPLDKEQDQVVSVKDIRDDNLKMGYYPTTISWWDSGNGFICKYSADKVCSMIRFDKQGKYVETLKQKEWNDTAALQPYFKQSQYKSQKVTAYWEVSDTNKKGYYVEMIDRKNNISCAWVDAEGKFSKIPSTPSQNSNISK